MIIDTNVRICRGEKSMEFDRKGDFLLAKIDGNASVDPSLKIQNNAQGDGGYIESDRVLKRDVSISVIPCNRQNAEALRAELISFILPHEDYEIYISRNGRTRKIVGRMSGEIKVSSAAVWWANLYTMTFSCQSPFLQDEAEQIISFRNIVPLFAFPLSTYIGAGTVSGMMTTADKRYLINQGDTEIGIIASIAAYAGTVKNPSISNGKDYVKVLCEMNIGDEIEISTIPGNKYIKYNGENFMFFDRNSVFFSIKKGVSEVSVSAEDDTIDNIKSEVRYTNLYSGV